MLNTLVYNKYEFYSEDGEYICENYFTNDIDAENWLREKYPQYQNVEMRVYES